MTGWILLGLLALVVVAVLRAMSVSEVPLPPSLQGGGGAPPRGSGGEEEGAEEGEGDAEDGDDEIVSGTVRGVPFDADCLDGETLTVTVYADVAFDVTFEIRAEEGKAPVIPHGPLEKPLRELLALGAVLIHVGSDMDWIAADFPAGRATAEGPGGRTIDRRLVEKAADLLVRIREELSRPR